MVYSEDEIQKIAEAGKRLALALAELEKEIHPGVSTLEIEEKAQLLIEKQGARPAFLGYQGYPAAVCTSVNEEVVHGIPSKEKILKEGDLVGIDIGLEYEGFFADMAKTYAVGKVGEEAQKLIEVTEKALALGVSSAKSGSTLGDLGFAIQNYVESFGFSVIRDLVGHGVGKHIHEDPSVPNFGKQGQGQKLVPGMVLAIEPMVAIGDWHIKILADGWTVVTADQSLAAHFEHTVLVTSEGGKILTQ